MVKSVMVEVTPPVSNNSPNDQREGCENDASLGNEVEHLRQHQITGYEYRCPQVGLRLVATADLLINSLLSISLVIIALKSDCKNKHYY